MALQEGRIGRVDQGIVGAVEEGSAALALQRLLEFLEGRWNLCRGLVVFGLARGVGVIGGQINESRQIFDPRSVDGPLHWILWVKPRRYRLVQVFCDRTGFE